MRIVLPEKVKGIIEKLTQNGYEAYAVGGCVRDSILGRVAHDWDITTSASPWQVKELFRHTVDTGIKHGTVTVMIDKEGFEVTTYRIDGEYEDSRHPKEVRFTKDLREDLRRRDFTINAMAYNEQDGLVDLFGGMEDMERGIIRCVGEPMERFTEDALRILRAFRFSAQLDFVIDKATRAAARTLAPNLKNISAERIRTELAKLLVSNHPTRLLDAAENGITQVVFPEFDAMLATPQRNTNHQYDVGHHTIYSVWLIADAQRQADYIRNILPEFPVQTVISKRVFGEKEREMLRLAAVLHDVAKPKVAVKNEQGEDRFYGHAKAGAPMAKEILRRFKYDNETIDTVGRLVAVHDYYQYERNEIGMRQTMYRIGPDLMELLFELQLADVLTQHPSSLELKLKDIAVVKKLHQSVCERGDCVSLKQLAVNGKDLIAIGIPAGKQMGEQLNYLLEQVLIHPELNQKESLLALCKLE